MTRFKTTSLLIAGAALALAGCGSSSGSPDASATTDAAAAAVADANAAIAGETVAPDPPPPPPTAAAAVQPKADARLNGKCAYLLGDFTESARGYRFVSSATVRNTGNIGVVVRFETTWRQAGGPAIRRHKDVRVPRGKSRFVNLNVIVSQDQISQIQAVPYDSQCGWKGTIMRYFGKAV